MSYFDAPEDLESWALRQEEWQVRQIDVLENQLRLHERDIGVHQGHLDILNGEVDASPLMVEWCRGQDTRKQMGLAKCVENEKCLLEYARKDLESAKERLRLLRKAMRETEVEWAIEEGAEK